MRPGRTKTLAAVAAVLLVAFTGAQLVGPRVANLPVTADLPAPPAVKDILRMSCYDCHSNQTELRWFDRIAPASWLVADDVARGRSRLNFSDIGALPAAQQRGALFDSVNQIRAGLMPPGKYTFVHPGAAVRPEQLETLMSYLASSAPRRPGEPTRGAAAAPGDHRPHAGAAPAEVQPAPNGLTLPRDYVDWTAVSSTERFDNGTLRVVLGNDVARRAVDEHRTNPWPDGTMFAKVAWDQASDGDGSVVVRPGGFVQVELMAKDRTRYASTAGWGWGRWKGTDLKPYGSGADFTTECVGCHTPMQANDYVFTVPMHTRRELSGELPVDPFRWKVISSAVDDREATMAILYGNDVAVRSARTAADAYPPGSILALATWQRHGDDHWFGARIPGGLQSIEVVRVNGGPDGSSDSYEEYRGALLGKVATIDPEHARRRMAEIVHQGAAMMPGSGE
jgi:Haem-binding domain/Cytochrome P460